MSDSIEPLLLAAQQRVGESLRGKYLLERLIGVGGMAAVYEGTHRNGMRVAIKLLHKELVSDKDVRTRFQRESYAANRIDHPGVVRVLDDDEDATGNAFIAMELLDGDTLDHEWENAGRKLSLARVLYVVDSLLDILDAAHAAGVVHRDLKPDNVVVLRDGRLKVLDFGIAHLMDASRRLTLSGQLMGTPEYMSPEQAGGESQKVGPHSDLFSIGAMAFTLLSGEYVQSARTSTERMIYAATRPSRSITTVLPELAPDLAHVIDVALAFETTTRWESARAMRVALRHAGVAAGVVDAQLSGQTPGAEPRDEVQRPSTTTLASGSAHEPRRND